MKYIVLILFVLIGCKEENKTKDKLVYNPIKQENIFKYKIDFPDTVFVNDKNDGEIIYESPFDTITDNFSDPDKSRYVVFRTLPNKSYNFLRDFYIDSLKEYRIGAIDNKSIPFYEFSFNKTGTYKIEGLINDQILIESNTKYNNDKNKLRLIEKDFPVAFKVVVIDSAKRK